MTNGELERYMALYYKTVYRVALFRVKNPADADDIAQDVFFKLYTCDNKFAADAPVKAWLIKCAVNQSRNLLGSYRYRFGESLPENDDRVWYDEKDKAPVYDIPLMKLDEKYRTALYLHYYEGYTAKEIAKMTGSSVAAVLSRLMRGRDRLKKLILSERNDENGDR